MTPAISRSLVAKEATFRLSIFSTLMVISRRTDSNLVWEGGWNSTHPLNATVMSRRGEEAKMGVVGLDLKREYQAWLQAVGTRQRAVPNKWEWSSRGPHLSRVSQIEPHPKEDIRTDLCAI
jgi:hypothetical protein